MATQAQLQAIAKQIAAIQAQMPALTQAVAAKVAEAKAVPTSLASSAKPSLTVTTSPTGQIVPRTLITTPAAILPPATPTITPPVTAAPTTAYTGVSIVDYLKSIRQPSDFASRTALATQYGISNYIGSAEQNTRLLGMLRSGFKPTIPTTGIGAEVGAGVGAEDRTLIPEFQEGPMAVVEGQTRVNPITGENETYSEGKGWLSSFLYKPKGTTEVETEVGAGTGAEAGVGTTGVTTEDQDFKDLQQKIMNQILDSLSTFEQPKTISERYEQRQLAAEQATEKAKELTESRYKEAITAEEEAGGRTLTAEQEARRGFATNTALFRQMEDTTKKRVNDLRRQRDDALTTQDIVLADKIDDLIMQEETAITTARTNYLNTLFAVSGELRAQAGFETPEQKQAGESARALQSTLDTLKLNYANVPGIENITSIAGAVSLLGPVLDEKKKRNLYRQDLQDKKLETDILLNQKKMGEPDLDWTTIIGSETDYRKEYQSRQVIKDWQFLRRQTGMMETAWDRLKEVMKTGDMNKISAARTTTDQVLGVVFQKMLDPTSVVRESEFARTTMGQAVIERAQSWFEQLRKGGIGVTDKLRQDLVDAAETLFGVTTEYKNETDREFEALVNSANERGVPLNIDNIIGPTTGATSEWEYIPDTGTTGNTYWYNPETMVGKRSTTSPGTGWVNMGTY